MNQHACPVDVARETTALTNSWDLGNEGRSPKGTCGGRKGDDSREPKYRA